MDILLPLKKYFNYLGTNITSSLIDYFFTKKVEIFSKYNKNSILSIKKIGIKNVFLVDRFYLENEIAINPIETENIRLIINFNKLIPNLHIENLDCKLNLDHLLKLLMDDNNDSIKFNLWHNIHNYTKKIISKLDELMNEMSKYLTLNISETSISILKFKFLINYIYLIKNNNEIKLKIKKIKLIFKNYCIGKIYSINIGHEINNPKQISKINIKLIKIYIDEFIIKNDIINELKSILNNFKDDEDNNSIITVDKIIININIKNNIKIEFNEICFENNKIQCKYITIYVLKKKIFVIKNLIYDMKKIRMEEIILKIYKTTFNKIKNVLKFFTQYFKSKSRSKKVLKLKKKGLNNNYLDELNKNKSKLINSTYIFKKIDQDIFVINNFKIIFYENNGEFVFKNFKYCKIDEGFCLNTTKWIFYKDNIRYLDSLSSNEIFKIEITNNIMNIIPYKLYLNLDIKQFGKTFSILASCIDDILSCFKNNNNQNNYIFEKFYLNSFRSIFSYNSQNVNIVNFVTGDYNEILNMLEISNIDIILKDISIMYPENFTFILKFLIKKIIEDVLENNFDSIIKTTPIALTYKLKKKLFKLPRFANKIVNIISNKF